MPLLVALSVVPCHYLFSILSCILTVFAELVYWILTCLHSASSLYEVIAMVAKTIHGMQPQYFFVLQLASLICCVCYEITVGHFFLCVFFLVCLLSFWAQYIPPKNIMVHIRRTSCQVFVDSSPTQ